MRVRSLGISLCILMLMASGSIAHAVEYGGLGGVPANPDPSNARTKSIFVYTLGPGKTKQDGINVINNTGEVKSVEVYATDSEVASGGSFACRQKVDTKTGVGGWIHLATTELRLEPNTNQIVPFTIAIPADTSVGEHNGCLVVQEKSISAQKAANGVQLSFRSALRVAVTVPGDIKKEIDFKNLSVKPGPAKYVLTAQLFNRGNVSLDTDVQVFVTTWYNRRVYQNGGIYPLLAQKSPVELNFEYPRPFWGGLYKLSAHANYNGDPKQGLGSSAPKDIQKTVPSRLLFVMPRPPALAIELLGLIVLLGLIWICVRRFSGRRKVAKSWHAYTVRDGDTIVGLAKQYHTKWKTIVRINKLKPPYDLSAGMKLKLPKIKNE